MSIVLDHSDFQCLQDQLVELRTKSYELVEENKRSKRDFEAAKTKICTLQLQLEEQERDFQVTSSTLRKEIESVQRHDSETLKENEESYKNKYKKLLLKAKELQQRYDKSLEVVQQMNTDINFLENRIQCLEEENSRLRQCKQDELQSTLQEQTKDYEEKLKSAIEERDIYKHKAGECGARLEQHIEEKRIQDKKGLQIVRELKRQLTLEKNKSETLQKRLENILSDQANQRQQESGATDIVNLSTSASSSNSACPTNGNGSWSLLPAVSSNSAGSGEDKASKCDLSICSVNLSSDDRETVQRNAETKSESGGSSSLLSSPAKGPLSASPLFAHQPHPNQNNFHDERRRDSSQTHISNVSSIESSVTNNTNGAQRVSSHSMPLDYEQVALMERLTRLQHDKWTLEEKLSYLEQANMALSEDLANKSDIIRNYFMNQAAKSCSNSNNNDLPPFLVATSGSSSGGISQLLSDKSGLKKVVDFLKERSQQVASTIESDSISKEATKKMQLMLEETLIKCLKLRENLDFVTAELNKLKQS